MCGKAFIFRICHTILVGKLRESFKGGSIVKKMTFEQYDALVERLGNNEYQCGDWWPTVDELKSKVGHNTAKYMEFLIWIVETADEPTEQWQVESQNYINKLLNNYIMLVDEEDE